MVEKPPFFMKAGGAKVIHINFSSAMVDPVYFPQLEVVGDIANTIWQLGEAITPQARWDLVYYNLLKSEIEMHLKDGAADARGGAGAWAGGDAPILSRLSEEHGVVEEDRDWGWAPGDLLEIVPNHACPVVNLAEFLYITEGEGADRRVVAAWPVEARAKVR